MSARARRGSGDAGPAGPALPLALCLQGPKAVLGPGTGLGEALLFWDDSTGGYKVHPSGEAGLSVAGLGPWGGQGRKRRAVCQGDEPAPVAHARRLPPLPPPPHPQLATPTHRHHHHHHIHTHFRPGAEGSHATFAPRGWKQRALQAHVEQERGHCSVERVSLPPHRDRPAPHPAAPRRGAKQSGSGCAAASMRMQAWAPGSWRAMCTANPTNLDASRPWPSPHQLRRRM